MKEYFEFQGVKYGIGTILKIPRSLDIRWSTPEESMREVEFVGGGRFIFTHRCGETYRFDTSGHFSGKYEPYIEIVTPVYYQEPEPPKPQNIFFRTGSGSWDAYNEVCIGFTWYIAVMLLATIFNARVGIWVLATIVYFSWKANK